MRKSTLADGRPIICIKIEHYVKATDFAKHLADHFFIEKQPFDEKIKRLEAMEILKRGLFHNGLKGEIDTTMYEASDTFGEEWNPLYESAMQWVKKNYPYLTPTT